MRKTRNSQFNTWKCEAFDYDSTKNYSDQPQVSIGEMKFVCGFCKALKFKNEPPKICCSNGKVFLPPLNDPPQPLLSYLSGMDE